MILSVVSLVVLGALVAGIVAVARRPGSNSNASADRTGAALRLYLYVMAFGGLVAVLLATAGTVSLVLEALIPQGATIISTGDTIARTSLYLAALVVGLPVWLVHMIIAERRATTGRELASLQRQLYFAAVSLTAALVVLFSLESLLRFFLSLASLPDVVPSARTAIGVGTRVLIYGGAWAGHAWWRTRAADVPGRRIERDVPHDLAVFILTGTALVLMLFGMVGALRELLRDLLALVPGAALPMLTGPPGGSWGIWAPITARVVSSGAMWAVAWHYDLMRTGNHPLRIVYLYLVLLVSAPTAIGSGVVLLYEVVRRLFGYSDPEGTWNFLRDVLPLLVASAAAWFHHWHVIRMQRASWAGYDAGTDSRAEGVARPVDATPGTEAQSGGIAWPRRPAIAFLTVAGLAVAAPGFVAILWVGLDLVLHTTGTVVSADWWRDRVSMGLAATVVGGIVWLAAWSILESSAAVSPQRERTAPERRVAIGAIVLVSALTAIGFLIALLWLLFGTLLGDTTVQNALSSALKDLSTVAVALTLARYYAHILRGDARVVGSRPASSRLRLVVYAAPEAGEMLRLLRDRTGADVVLAGQLETEAAGISLPSTFLTLDQMIESLSMDSRSERVLVLLYPAGGCLLPYVR